MSAEPAPIRTAAPDRHAAWLLVGLGVGIALRAFAAPPAHSAAEWEADQLLWAWAEPGTRVMASGCRPPGLASFWALLGAVLPGPSLLAVRACAIGLSVLMLGCAWELARVWLRSRAASLASMRRARLWLCALWAVTPMLVWSGSRLVPELLSGALVCLATAACVRFGMAPSLRAWLWLCVTCAAALAVGGVVVASGLAVGLLVFLAPVPRLRTALPVLGAGFVAAVAALGFAAWHEPGRPWRPDTGPAYALAYAIDAPLLLDEREAALPELRGDAVWRSCGETLAARPLTATLGALGRRAQALIAPWRFDGTVAPAPLGTLDAWLTGAVLVLAASTLGRRSAPAGIRQHRLHRLVTGAALLTWAIASIAGATGPFALSGTVLVAVALAAVSLSSAVGRPVLLIAGVVAGGLLCMLLALTPVRAPAPPASPSPVPAPAPDPAPLPAAAWLQRLTHAEGQGRDAVALYLTRGPLGGADHMHLAQLFMDPAAPFLRRPRLALAHALAALEQFPTNEETLTVLVRAEVECLSFQEAEDFAHSMLDEVGGLSLRGRMLGNWVRDRARRARLDGLR